MDGATAISIDKSAFSLSKFATETLMSKGKIKYKNGDIYEGTFTRGIKEGEGIYRFKPGLRVYTGEFKNDTITGRGKMEFDDKKMVYEGEFIAGMMHGRGKMSFQNGINYDGEWVEDLMQGEGTLTMTDGSGVKG
jgi:hypothetical protein